MADRPALLPPAAQRPGLRPGRRDGPPDGQLRLPHRRPRDRRGRPRRPRLRRAGPPRHPRGRRHAPDGVLATHYHADHIGGHHGPLADRGDRAAARAGRRARPRPAPTRSPWVERTHRGGRAGPGRRTTAATCVAVGEVEIDADPHAGPHARAASASSSTAAWSPATPSSSTAAGGPTSPARTRSQMYESLTPAAGPRSPTTPCSSPGHLYSAEPSHRWARPAERNWVLAPRSAEEWLAMFG